MKRNAAASATLRPVATLPVKQILSTRSIRAAPVSPAPSMNASTSRRPSTAWMVRISGRRNLGAISLGLTMAAHPATSAGIVSRVDRSSGKFQGLMMPTSA